MSTIAATNLKNASSGSNNVVLNSDGSTTVSNGLKFNSGYGSAATAYGCRAWVNFNGTGTVAIRASGNVSSITDNGVGNYTVNFTTAMPDVNYSTNISCAASSSAGTDASNMMRIDTVATGSVSFRIGATNTSNIYSSYYDNATVCVAIFR